MESILRQGIYRTQLYTKICRPTLCYTYQTTTVNNRTYRGLGDFTTYTMIYEDTISNIIYCINSSDYGSTQDSNEYVFFDYNLKTGDTFTSAITPINYTTKAKCVVTNVDSIKLNGYWHKRFLLNYFRGMYTGTATFIEGIGTGRPLATLTGPCDCTFVYQKSANFLCFHQAGNVPQTDTGSLYNCDVTLSLKNIENNKEVKIYPQPASTYAILEMTETSSGILRIVNPLGQIVLEQNIEHQNKVTIHNNGLLHGLYYYKINTQDGQHQYSGKLLFK